MKKQEIFDYIYVRYGDSYVAIAKKTGIPYTTIKSYVTAIHRQPRRDFFEKIAKEYNLLIVANNGEIELISKDDDISLDIPEELDYSTSKELKKLFEKLGDDKDQYLKLIKGLTACSRAELDVIFKIIGGHDDD
jgi:3-dehydroquinate synthase class II